MLFSGIFKNVSKLLGQRNHLIVAFYDVRDSFAAFEAYKRDGRLAPPGRKCVFGTGVSVHWADRNDAIMVRREPRYVEVNLTLCVLVGSSRTANGPTFHL